MTSRPTSRGSARPASRGSIRSTSPERNRPTSRGSARSSRPSSPERNTVASISHSTTQELLRDFGNSEVADASLAMMCSALPADELSYLLTMLARTVRRQDDECASLQQRLYAASGGAATAGEFSPARPLASRRRPRARADARARRDEQRGGHAGDAA